MELGCGSFVEKEWTFLFLDYLLLAVFFCFTPLFLSQAWAE
jgi:hypothetical protein